MTENRGNPSVSKSNLPRPDGITRPTRDDTYKSIDTKTIKEMQSVYSGLTKFAIELGGNLEDFNETLEKSAKSIVSTRQQLDKTSKEYDAEVAEMKKHYFGANKKIAEDYEEFVEEKKKLLEKEFEKTRKEERKNIIKQSFKNETKENTIKMLDNKYARNNKFDVLHNEYYNQLEKLKTSAIDTFDDGLNNDNYKSALLALQNDFTKQFNDLKKEELMTSYQGLITVGSSVKDGLKTTFESNQDSLRGLLGPLNLFIEPFSKFFGKGISTLFSGIKKKKPNANDVANTGAFGMGSLFIVDSLYKIFGKDKKNQEKESKFDKIKNIFGKGGMFGASSGMAILGKKGALKGMMGKLGKVAGPAMIVVAIIEMAIDAIKGIFKSKEWGVSKISGALGSFLGGASEGGLKNAFASMGKWALLGAGIGSVVPVIGTIAGGVVGGAIGMILGAFGGKNLAKQFDKFGNAIKTMLINMWEALKDLFNVNKFISIFKSDESLGKKIGKSIGLFIVTGFEMIPKLMKKLFSGASNLVSNVIERSGKIKDAIGNLGVSLLNGISNGFNKAKDFAKNTWEGIKEFGGDVWEGLKESELADFVKNIFVSLNEGINKFFNENPVGKWMDSYIISPIKKAFSQMGAWFSYIGKAFEKDGITGALSAMTVGMLKKDKSTGLTEFETYKQNLLNPTSVDDAIIRADGSIIKTNPKDTLVALKNIPLSMEQVRSDTTKNLNSSLGSLGGDKNLEKKLTTIIEVLSKILAKDVQVNLPPQTRTDLDMIMSGGMI
jgi:hypothetical protein